MQNNLLIDTSELASDFFDGKKVDIGFQYPTEDIFIAINALVSKILSRKDLHYLIDTSITVIREIVLNALKANAKRIFFKKNNMDINSPVDYNAGMKEFRKMVTNFSNLQNEINNSNLRIVTKFENNENGISVEVYNNINIQDQEHERIAKRLKESKKNIEFNDLYNEFYDSTEGAGLGIILSILLLKNAGINNDFFVINTGENFVKIKLLIPYETRKVAITSEITEKIIEEINSLPTFPEYIMELQHLCDSTNSKIETIANKILMDPSLTADVLKLSNSAGFITGKRIDNINEAIIIIGLKNLKSILLTTASRKILDKRYRKYEKIWDHCNRTAFYARAIAEYIKKPRLSDQLFICGLLHDIGKIVLLASDEKLANQIFSIIGEQRKRSTTVLEEISIGISHTTIGALIAEKWNFPDYLIESIKFHHSPINASKNHRETVMIVYLANMLCEIEKQNFDISFIETKVLEKLKLSDKIKFENFFDTIRLQYEIHYTNLKG